MGMHGVELAFRPPRDIGSDQEQRIVLKSLKPFDHLRFGAEDGVPFNRLIPRAARDGKSKLVTRLKPSHVLRTRTISSPTGHRP